MDVLQEPSQEIKTLITQFVQTYSDIVDLELDENLTPKRWFMPLNDYAKKREAVHYFLLAASLNDYRLTGNPRNIRLLLNYLHETLNQKMYTIKNPEPFRTLIMQYEQRMENFDHLGTTKNEISHILSRVNKYVQETANGDMIEYTNRLIQRGLKPTDLVKELSFKIEGMTKHQKSKSWLYLRWMTRPSPDLQLFNYNPEDLMIPLTTPKLRVAVALGLTQNENLPFELNVAKRPESWWKDTAEFDKDTENLTNFAKSLFPEDPAKIDFPFFILGTWLEYADLTPKFLEKSLKFLIQKHQELLQPIMRYLTIVGHYNKIGEALQPGAFTGFEADIYQFLQSRQIIFNYEFMEFRLPKNKHLLTYKPDFLLPQYTDHARKVILEPHGIRKNLNETLFKLSTFRQHYGEFFCLILIVPDHFTNTIQKLDPEHKAYDYLWKQSDYKIQFEKFRKT